MLKHAFECSIPDDSNVLRVQPQRDWNAEHAFDGGTHKQFLMRDTSVDEGASWSSSFGLDSGSLSALSIFFNVEPTLGVYRPTTATIGLTADNAIQFRRQSGTGGGNIYASMTYSLTGYVGGVLAFADATGNAIDIAIGRAAAGKLIIGNAASAGVLLDVGTLDGTVHFRNRGDTLYAHISAASVRGNAVTFANRPGTPVEGMLVAITDSTTTTRGATITGSGANHVLGYYNGTNWVVV